MTVALLVCGSLVRDVQELVRARGWDAHIYGVTPLHHLHPDRIVDAVDKRLTELEDRYDRCVVVYGDCGTSGRLDAVLARHGATRPDGPHCYEMLAGAAYHRITAERPGTFFLTPWLIRNFDRYVAGRLGLDEHPDLVRDYFHRFTHAVYLRRSDDPFLEKRAQEIADRLGLQLEIRDTGLDELGMRLAPLVET